ncbi:MAG: antibiotic biosynthesis monooxygenase family protein [Chloroflexota bacterium]
MALLSVTYDLPSGGPSPDYAERVGKMLQDMLKQPGLKEFRGYRNPLKVSPHVLTQSEWEDLESITAYLKTDVYDRIMQEMSALGCANIAISIWDASPVTPEPIRP